MPVATIHLPKNIALDTGRVLARWSTFSEISSDEMTLNVVDVREQVGRPYAAMAWLHLPTRWSPLEREDLGLALARALAEVLDVSADRVFVHMVAVQPGHVFESGEVVRW